MAESRFHPKPLSTVITLVLFTVMIGLGVWQVQRLHWKEALLATIHDNMAQKPVPMPEKIGDTDAWAFRRVTLAGTFDYRREMLVKPRTYEGEAGYDMVVPFTRVSGGTVLVDRGWISDATLKKAQRPQGLTKIEGILRDTKKPSSFTPDNNPAKKDWFWIDVNGMAQANGIAAVAPMVLVVSDKKPGVYPIGGRVQVDLPNDHKQYATFWFGMAFVLLAVWFLSHFERAPKLEKKYAGI